jgi:hypothetical protein
MDSGPVSKTYNEDGVDYEKSQNTITYYIAVVFFYITNRLYA